MGRELKRVPLDFNWPIGRIWEGYIQKHYKPCPDCKRGYTPAREFLEKCLQELMWSGSEALSQEHRVQLVELTTGLAGRPPYEPIGHDSIDLYVASKAIIKAAKLPENWGICTSCEGHAETPESRKLSEHWERVEPPTGEGYQLWGTTSEGEPMTPVFKSLDELCEYCEKNVTTFGRFTASKKQWKEMLSENYVTAKVGNMVFC